MTLSTAINEMMPAPTADTYEDRAQQYMHDHNLGFCFSEDGRLITRDEI